MRTLVHILLAILAVCSSEQSQGVGSKKSSNNDHSIRHRQIVWKPSGQRTPTRKIEDHEHSTDEDLLKQLLSYDDPEDAISDQEPESSGSGQGTETSGSGQDAEWSGSGKKPSTDEPEAWLHINPPLSHHYHWAPQHTEGSSDQGSSEETSVYDANASYEESSTPDQDSSRLEEGRTTSESDSSTWEEETSTTDQDTRSWDDEIFGPIHHGHDHDGSSISEGSMKKEGS